MTFAFQRAAAVAPESLADTLTRGFADYAVPIAVTTASLAVAQRIDGFDPALSVVIARDGELVGAALIARRGNVSRLASMAVVPAARRLGVARALMSELLGQARARGDDAMELEVIEQNSPAVRLYESFGFERRRRLLGYEGKAVGDRTATDLESVSIADVAAVIRADGAPALPWQISADTIERLDSPWAALRAGPSFALISDPTAETISLRALITRKVARRRGHARRLLESLFAQHPGKAWRVSSLCPEEEAPVLERAGLGRSALSQLQMTLDLRR